MKRQNKLSITNTAISGESDERQMNFIPISVSQIYVFRDVIRFILRKSHLLIKMGGVTLYAAYPI